MAKNPSLRVTHSPRRMAREIRQETENGTLPTGDHWRPEDRSVCEGSARPCLYVACKYNLFTDITDSGSIRFPFGDDPQALLTMEHTCALDVAESGGLTLEKVAKLTNVTRERVRQVEQVAMTKMRYEAVRPGTGEWEPEED